MSANAEYLAIGRCMDGVAVMGYALRHIPSGKLILVDRKSVEGLAMTHRIMNMTAQLYEEKVILKGMGCKLSELPSYDKKGNRIKRQEEKDKVHMEIRARISNGKHIVGYKVARYENGLLQDERIVERDRILDLAKGGQLKNARVQMSNGKIVLRGVNCELSKIPTITYSSIS